MSDLSDPLHSYGYSDCFYQDGALWGFLNHDVMPQPIPQEVIQAANLHTPRRRLMNRAQLWCDRRGIPVGQRPLSE